MNPKPPTILYLLTELNVGGAERNLYELARHASAAGFRPLVAAFKGRGPIAGWLADANVPVYDLQLGSRIDPACFLRLVNLLRREKVDILHSFLFHANVVGSLAALARTPIVISSVRVAERERPWHPWLEGLTNPLVDVTTCVSDSVRSFTHSRAGIPFRKLITIRNGVDLSRFTLSRAEARSRLNLDPGLPLVVFVGRFVPQKSVELIPHIARLVLNRVGNARFLLVGAGPLRERVEASCNRLGISGSVDFLGQRDDVPTILAASDVLILPSRWEGLANVILEAQAAGAAVVATDVEGTREAIDHERTGLILPTGRPEAFADAVIRLLTDAPLRHALAVSGRSHVETEATLDQMVSANFALYKQLLAHRKG